MGSSRRPKPHGRPVRVTPPGKATGTGGVELADEKSPRQLVIPLVAIDQDTAARASLGDPVHVVETADAHEVRLRERRLGNIPPRFTAPVRTGYRRGAVSELSLKPLSVVVTLRR